MSKNWVQDMEYMHTQYGVHDWVDNKVRTENNESLRQFLAFRLNFLQEELDETFAAFKNEDPQEIVDGLIDLCVIAIGTLDAFNCDAEGAWDEVLRANLSKEVGVKASRPNPLGLPDLIKPEGWEGPDHSGKVGYLDLVFEEEELPKW